MIPRIHVIALAVLVISNMLWATYAMSLVAQRDRARLDRAELRAAQVGIVSANREWETATLGLQSSLAQCQGQWADAQADADAAVELAAAYKREAKQQQADFERRWKARTSDCRASLEQMQAACAAEIGDY